MENNLFFCLKQTNKFFVSKLTLLRYCDTCRKQFNKSNDNFLEIFNEHLLTQENYLKYVLKCIYCQKSLFKIKHFLNCEPCKIAAAINHNKIQSGTCILKIPHELDTMYPNE